MKKTLLALGLFTGLQTATAETTLSTVSGTWYDPVYSGSGFNMVEFSNGLFAYFYGYKSNFEQPTSGNAQWLLTKSAIPTPIIVGKTYEVKMVSGFIGNGGTFTTKPNGNHSGVKDWGIMHLTFNSCQAGVVRLMGTDGLSTHNIIPLGQLEGLTCSETQSTPAMPLKKFGIFTVMSDNNTVVMDGVISTGALTDFQQLIQQYPTIKTVNIKNCPGSTDDDANLKLSKLIHDKGINTHVMDNGEISSGGVDFFVAGIKRTLGTNTKVGVHSWAGGDGDVATDYPRGHQNHLQYIEYYKSVGFTQKQAEDFYYFTIYAAPAESVHWMTATELKKYGVVTH